MRSAIGVLAVVLAGCGAKYRPTEPVLTPYERGLQYPPVRSHEELRYSGSQPATTAPVVPVLAFGAAFDLDFVLMPANDDDFEMIEIARVSMPEGNQWLALETSSSGAQTLVANLDDIEAFMPEIAVERVNNNFQVVDRCTENTVDIGVEYTNSKGQKVTAELTGDPPGRENKRRNGKTFDHSANSLMAVLDVSASESLFKADVKIDGNGLKLKKVAGIVPARFTLVQAQGGMSTGTYKSVPTGPAVGGADLGLVAINAPGEAPAARPPGDVLVKLGVAQNAAGVGQCWKDRLAEKADLTGGELAFTFRIAGGAVSEVAPAKGEPAFQDEALSTCVVAAIGTWKFDPSISGEVSWPFSFMPADEENMKDAAVGLGEGEIRLDAAPEAPAPASEGAVPAPAPAEGGGTGAVPKDAVPEPADSEGGPGEPILPQNDEGAEGGSDDLDESLDEDGGTGAVPAAPAEGVLSSFTTVHALTGDRSVELKWLVSRQGDRVTARQTTDLRTLTYNYRLVQGNYLELVTVTVEQYGRATPVTAVTFSPPLPDLRWPFSGKFKSDFVIDVNGQQSFARGTAEAFWTESGPKVQYTGDAPKWVEERPLLSQVSFGKDGSISIETSRAGD